MNTALLKLSNEFIQDVKFLEYVLLSNDIKIISWRQLYEDTTEIKVCSDTHFKEGYGNYTLHFEMDEFLWNSLKEIKLSNLIEHDFQN